MAAGLPIKEPKEWRKKRGHVAVGRFHSDQNDAKDVQREGVSNVDYSLFHFGWCFG